MIENLGSDRSSVAVWGLGYIGLTTLHALLSAGFRVRGVDTSADRLDKIANEAVLLNSDLNIAVDVRPFLANGSLTLSNDLASHDGSVVAHFICVPTERAGTAYDGAIAPLVERLLSRWPDAFIVVESTLSPRWLMNAPLADERVIVAPRRDWFHAEHHTLKALTRVVGAASDASLTFAIGLLGAVSDSIVTSDDRIAVAASKAFENSLWYLLFSYVSELAARQSDCNVTEMLRLAKTNWRTPFDFAPAFQVGGYCLPLARHYLSELVGDDATTLLHEAAASNVRTLEAITQKVVGAGARRVLILGLTYRSGIPVVTNAAGTLLIGSLSREGVEVWAHDPLLSEQDVEALGAHFCSLEVGSTEWDCVVVCLDHKDYRAIDASKLLHGGRCSSVLDCFGVWEHQRAALHEIGIRYQRFGEREWSCTL